MSDVSAVQELQQGAVKFYSPEKGYGFIKMPDGQLDVFFHAKQLRQSGITRALSEGEQVRFVVAAGPKGQYAEQISLIQEPING